jgi:predicted PhzF superfamily epimerase YddE/YHI9
MIVHHVDAFTSRPFAGNPAAVCLLDEDQEASWMHALAAELNLPKTAFLRRAAADQFHLRWFAADGEAELCGHATLASAHVLWEIGEAAPAGEISFLTRSGELRARRVGSGWIEIDFPAEVAVREDRRSVAAALGVAPLWMGRNRLHFLVEVASEETVRALRPDFPRLAAALPPARGVMVTARAAAVEAVGAGAERDGGVVETARGGVEAAGNGVEAAAGGGVEAAGGGVEAAGGGVEAAGGGVEAAGGYDFVSRYFAPLSGAPEDPATGSSHCALGPYWAAKLGKTDLLAYQASARGGWLRVRAAGPRVQVAGQAVTVLRGELVTGSARREG